MSKTAILVDGGFFRKRIPGFYDHSPSEAVDALVSYCMRHLHEHSHNHELYRIFYYDCPPSTKQIFHPLLGRTVN